MNILAIIPARGGSKGVPKKNIKELNGKPLISYTIESAKQSKYIQKVVVSTDDAEIANIAKRYGAEIPCLRPKELALDSSPTIDSIIHMLNYLNESQKYYPDYICLLQCTSPLRSSVDIDNAIEKLISTEMDGVISICEAEVNPYWTNVLVNDKLQYFIKEGKNILRRQDLPEIYRINGAIYIVKTDVFLKYKTFETANTTGYIMTNDNSIDIDTEYDFMLAEALMNERKKL